MAGGRGEQTIPCVRLGGDVERLGHSTVKLRVGDMEGVQEDKEGVTYCSLLGTGLLR